MTDGALNMDYSRLVKIQKNLHRILMDYFLTKSSTSYPGIISIKEIQIQPDLKRCNVYISVMGSMKDVQEVRILLEKDRTEMVRLVNSRLRIKYCPSFQFFVNHIDWDLSSVEQKLSCLKEQNEI